MIPSSIAVTRQSLLLRNPNPFNFTYTDCIFPWRASQSSSDQPLHPIPSHPAVNMTKLFLVRELCSSSFVRVYRPFSPDLRYPVRNCVGVVTDSTPTLRNFSSLGHDAINGRSSSDSCELSCHKRRPFCQRCMKAMKVCICRRFRGVVHNRTKVTILQNPKEKDHALGSSRIAMLGLDSIDLVSVQEADESIRVKQRCQSRQRRCEFESDESLVLPEIEARRLSKIVSDVFKDRLCCNIVSDEFERKANGKVLCKMVSDQSSEGTVSNVCEEDCDDHMHRKINANYGLDMYPSMHVDYTNKGRTIAHGSNMDCAARIKHGVNGIYGHGECNLHAFTVKELKDLIPHGVSLLYPSENAIELSALLEGKEENRIHSPLCRHLIVLDGTWSKAKRMYIENPWLHDLPHYKLLVSTPSLYGSVRKEPKPEYVSTLESIVYALKVLEPDITEGLDGLLAVFDSMIEDQRHFMNINKRSNQKYGT